MLTIVETHNLEGNEDFVAAKHGLHRTPLHCSDTVLATITDATQQNMNF